ADDAVQESWLRLSRSGASGVENLGGWLTTVVARVCLDMLRSRKARREEPLGTHQPEPVTGHLDGTDPEQQVVMADSIGSALLVVLQTLAPAERVAFVLHDMFGLPFEEIAPIVDRSPTAARQLASRATGARQRSPRPRMGSRWKGARGLRLHDCEREDRRDRSHRRPGASSPTGCVHPGRLARSNRLRWTMASTPTAAPREAALAALKASDRKLARLIHATKSDDPTAWRSSRPVGDAFSVLVASIIGQQISGFAARAIAGRLQERFGGRMPSPAELLTLDPAALKTVGLSRMKIDYLRSLAEHIISGEFAIDRLHELADDQVREQITAIKGLGRWTADMFLLINLERPDILPIGDLGIRSAVQRLYQLDHLPSPSEVDAIGEKWRPNRSLASFYLWAWNRQMTAVRPKGARPMVSR